MTHAFVLDVAPTSRRDPTGTASLRRAFGAASEMKWRGVNKMVRDAIQERDIFALGGYNATNIMTPHGRVEAFQSWFDTVLGQLVLVGNGYWMNQYVERAYNTGAVSARLSISDAEWDKGKHPRDPEGKFSETEGRGELANKEGGVAAYKGQQHGQKEKLLGGKGEHNKTDLILTRGIKDPKPFGTIKSYISREQDTISGKIASGRGEVVRFRLETPEAPFTNHPTLKSALERAEFLRKLRNIRLKSKRQQNDSTDSLSTLTAATVAELQGVMEAASQQAVRAFANGILTRQRAAKVTRDLGGIIKKVGIQRSRLLADYAVVRAHATGTLDAFQAAGVRKVGTLAESLPATRQITMDADWHEEDHPRDERGQFVYHGTATENLKGITEKGIIADPTVWVTSTPEGALKYGVGKELSVLRMKRESLKLNYSGHSRHGGVNEKTSTTIHPDHIEYWDGKQWKKLRHNVGDAAVFDAPRKPKRRPSGGRLGSPIGPRERTRIERRERRLARLERVDVLTAGDDKVCQQCEEIEENGPYDIDAARGLIPAHLNCRCAFVAASDDNDIGDAEWDEGKHPRHPAGSSEGGEFTRNESTGEETVNDLPENLKDPDKAERAFQSQLKYLAWLNLKRHGEAYVDMYHEGPGDLINKFKKDGIKSDYGVFASINRPSDFVIGDKTIVHFKLPIKEIQSVGPDMKYGHPNLSYHQAAFHEHRDLDGVYVSLSLDKIPPAWFKSVKFKKHHK